MVNIYALLHKRCNEPYYLLVHYHPDCDHTPIRAR